MPTPTVVFAANKDGHPVLRYIGEGSWRYSETLSKFNFNASCPSGESITVTGEIKLGKNNDAIIAMQTISKVPFDLLLLGLAKTNDFDMAENSARETIRVPAGEKNFMFDRFIIYTYEGKDL